MAKTKITVTIDEDLNELANVQYKNKSDRINELMKIDLYESDEKSKLVEELQKTKQKEKIITKKICELEKQEKVKRGSNNSIESVLKWAKDIYERRGVVGLNLLEKECKRNKVDFSLVRQKLEDEEVALVNYDA